MTRTPHSLLAIALALSFATAQQTPQGTEDHLAMGKMWTFENPPLAYLEKEYGFKPDQKWLDTLRLGALRLGERENPWCSASFVSPQGLIMTNHHCVRDKIAEIQGDRDLMTGGFAARALEDELPIPGLTVHQLIGQEDITARVAEGITDAHDATAAAKLREDNAEKIKAAADADNPGTMHQIVTLYQGAVTQLYRYRVYGDLRLVMAVNLQAAHFGGDPDNFTYPRWSIDFSFVRAWDGDKPADTAANWFRWRHEGAKDGELVFVPGNPGNTNRLFTKAQLEFQRDVEYPIMLQQWEDEMAAVRPFAEMVPQLKTALLGIENSYKSVSGTLTGLRDAQLMAIKQGHEERFRAAIASNPDLQARFGDIWEKIAELTQRRRLLQPKIAFHAAGYSPHLEIALAIVKAADPSLDDGQREAAKATALGQDVDINPLIAKLIPTMFTRAARWLPAGDPFLKALDGDVKTITRRLGRSIGGDKEELQELLAGGADAIASSKDYALSVARVLWPLQQANDKEQQEITAALAEQGRRIGQALHAVFGTKTSPDATMTLRFSDGLVAGYDYNGTKAPWATSFYGLYGRSFEFGNQYPFNLAEPWSAAKDSIDMTRKVCFASTNDIVGGNSGSCVVDKDLQVVGLIFDGNIESLANDFYYTQERARAVSVHTDAILEALTKVHDLQRIADELLGKGK